MDNYEIVNMASELKRKTGGCCLFLAKEALERCNYDVDMAEEYLKEKKSLGWDFDLNTFRKEYKKKHGKT